MAENSETKLSAGNPAEQGEAPRLLIQTQYTKDLSFENPRAPLTLEQNQQRPEIAVRVDVRVQPIKDTRYEVMLQLNIDAKVGEEAVFVLELTYAGVFQLVNIPKDSLQPLLLVECPRMLFPFARRIVADATRDGGFPPLMIDPIDFVALYRRRQEQAQAAAAQAAQASADEGQKTGTIN
ncbi:MAG: protein-export chaperone SecB [Alphaproteobacteria bacterium]|nr:protein-export chaperone SecB [Alphaproteobacteria bacterium]